MLYFTDLKYDENILHVLSKTADISTEHARNILKQNLR